MSKNAVRFTRIAFVVVAVAIAIQWWQSSRNQQAAAQIIGTRPAVLLNWLPIASNNNQVVTASKVLGGWFICLYNREPGDNLSVGGAFFYPDQTHVWDGGSIQ
jgi:hypothetical protein